MGAKSDLDWHWRLCLFHGVGRGQKGVCATAAATLLQREETVAHQNTVCVSDSSQQMTLVNKRL